MAVCLLFNTMRTFEHEEFAVGTVMPPASDVAEGRVYEQEDSLVFDTNLRATQQGNEGVDPKPRPSRARGRSGSASSSA